MSFRLGQSPGLVVCQTRCQKLGNSRLKSGAARGLVETIFRRGLAGIASGARRLGAHLFILI
jgi:hypothetical protein